MAAPEQFDNLIANPNIPSFKTTSPVVQGTNYAPVQTGVSFYTSYRSYVEYYRDDGLHPYPVAGTATDGSQACVLVQEYSPMLFAAIFWTAERLGSEPNKPHPILSPNSGCTFLTMYLRSYDPVTTENGQVYIYSRSGVYVYVLKTPGARVRDFPGLATPTLKATPAKNIITQGSFDSSLAF